MSANSFSVEKNMGDETLSYLDISLKIIKIFNSIKRQGSIIIHLIYFSVSDWVNSHSWFFLTPGRTRKFLPLPWNKRRGRGGGVVVMEPLPRVFDMLQYFETILPLVKAFDLLDKLKYILWVVALLETCIFTQNWLDYLLLMTSYLVTMATDHH